MNIKSTDNKMIDDLYDLILSLKSREDCRELFSDMCTNKEIEQMAQRIYAAKLLIEGKAYRGNRYIVGYIKPRFPLCSVWRGLQKIPCRR